MPQIVISCELDISLFIFCSVVLFKYSFLLKSIHSDLFRLTIAINSIL